MSRLPTPGSDDGTWGSILNDFLDVEHNTDGSLKLRTDGTLSNFYVQPTGGIPRSDFDSDVQGALLQASNAAQLGSNPAQDLGSVASAGVSNNAAREDHVHSTNGLALQSDLAAYYQMPAGGIPASDMTTNVQNALNAAGQTSVQESGVAVGTQSNLNFLAGSNVTITTAANAGNDSVDVTIAASGAGGGGTSFTAVAHTGAQGDYNASAGDFVVGDATAAAFHVQLPAPTNGAWIKVKKTDSTANAIIVSATAPATLDGVTSFSVNSQWQSNDFLSDGTNWYLA